MKRTSIGGQALMEGIMMRNGNEYAITVRKPDQTIETKVEKTKSMSDDYPILKAPFLRGVVNFAESLVVGMKSLNYSASFFDEEEEDSKTIESKEKKKKDKKEEKKNKDINKKNNDNEDNKEDKNEKGNNKEDSKIEDKNEKGNNKEDSKIEDKNEKGNNKEDSKIEDKNEEKNNKEDSNKKDINKKDAKKENVNKETTSKEENAMMIATIAISLVISIALFMIAPYLIASLFESIIDSMLLMSLMEGLIKILIFLGYIVIISNIKDIKRTYMYHGAEHKTINCLEAGEDLTVENVKKHSRIHKRCGTSFLLFVIIISIILFMFIRVDSVALRIALRLLLIPVIAGISYELIRLAGKSNSRIICLLSKPGMALQKLTTKEPEDDMIEVAIASVEAVFDWKPYVEAVRKGEIED